MRVMLIDPRTGEGFDWQAPADGVQRTVALSAPSAISMTLPAAYNTFIDNSGMPWVHEKATIVVVEESSGELVSGLVDAAPLRDNLPVDAGGLSMLAKAIPWTGPPVEWINKDALAAWREIWQHVIGRSGVKNFRITGDTRCGVTVGRGPSANYRRVQADIAQLKPEIERAERSIRVHTRNRNAAAQRLFQAGGGRKVVGPISVSQDSPQGTAGTYDAAHIVQSSDDLPQALSAYFYRTSDFRWVRYDSAAVIKAANDYLTQTRLLANWEDRRKPNADIVSNLESWLNEHDAEGYPEPYGLNQWSVRDLSEVLDELREIGGFDYVEHTEWQGDELAFSIEVRNTIGTPKPDLRLELNVNILSQPELSRGTVHSEVHAFGAGEGQSTLMADRAIKNPRLVRTATTVEDKGWQTAQQVRQGADKALAEAKQAMQYRLHGLVVNDHKAAPLHRLALGDIITVRGRHSDGVRREFPVRITEITRTGEESKVSLEVEPL